MANLSALTIKAECAKGYTITNAIKEAIKASKAIGVNVEFVFNECRITVSPNSVAAMVERMYYRWMRENMPEPVPFEAVPATEPTPARPDYGPADCEGIHG